MEAKLHINIDHIATLRNARQVGEPSLIEAIKIIEGTRACGITTHLREDRRHINDEDIQEIDEYLRQSRLGYTFEMGATEEIREICLKTQAKLATIVPEKREELTTEGGLDVVSQQGFLREFIKPIQDNSTKVSMFVDPILEQIQVSKEIGADSVEIHTGTYANLFIKYSSDQAYMGAFYDSSLSKKISSKDLPKPVQEEINRIKQAVSLAQELGLNVNLGHGLTVPNLPPLLENLPNIQELHIGHSVVSNAIFYGLPSVIASYQKCCMALSMSSEAKCAG